jgi:hypothetical protein
MERCTVIALSPRWLRAWIVSPICLVHPRPHQRASRICGKSCRWARRSSDAGGTEAIQRAPRRATEADQRGEAIDPGSVARFSGVSAGLSRSEHAP